MRSTLRRGIASAAAAGALAAAAGLAIAEGGDQIQPVVVRSLRGEVSVRASAGAPWRRANARERLRPGMQIRTGPDGDAVLQLSDRNLIRLGSGTELAIDVALVRREAGGSGMLSGRRDVHRFSLSLPRGSVAHSLRGLRNGSRFDLHTPVATAGVRGTDFFAEIEGGLSFDGGRAAPTPEEQERAHREVERIIQESREQYRREDARRAADRVPDLVAARRRLDEADAVAARATIPAVNPEGGPLIAAPAEGYTGEQMRDAWRAVDRAEREVDDLIREIERTAPDLRDAQREYEEALREAARATVPAVNPDGGPLIAAPAEGYTEAQMRDAWRREEEAQRKLERTRERYGIPRNGRPAGLVDHAGRSEGKFSVREGVVTLSGGAVPEPVELTAGMSAYVAFGPDGTPAPPSIDPRGAFQLFGDAEIQEIDRIDPRATDIQQFFNEHSGNVPHSE